MTSRHALRRSEGRNIIIYAASAIFLALLIALAFHFLTGRKRGSSSYVISPTPGVSTGAAIALSNLNKYLFTKKTSPDPRGSHFDKSGAN